MVRSHLGNSGGQLWNTTGSVISAAVPSSTVIIPSGDWIASISAESAWCAVHRCANDPIVPSPSGTYSTKHTDYAARAGTVTGYPQPTIVNPFSVLSPPCTKQVKKWTVLIAKDRSNRQPSARRSLTVPIVSAWCVPAVFSKILFPV